MKVFVKRLAAIAFAFAALSAHPQNTSSWAFYDIKLSELVRIAFSQLLGRSFVADHTFVTDTRTVSVDLKPGEADRAESILKQLLVDAGYTVRDDGQLVTIRKKETADEDEPDLLIYRPRNREARYLMDALGLGRNRDTGAQSPKGAPGAAGRPSTASANTEEPKADNANQYVERTNDIVIYRGKPREIEQTRRALEAIDRPQQQVDVAVVVYEYQRTEGDQTAIGAVLNLAKGKLGGQLGAVSGVGDFLKLDTSALQVLVSALSEDKRFQIVSSPNVRARSGAVARVTVGADVPTLASTTTSPAGQISQNVTYQKTGVILELKPLVFESLVDLQIRQAVSDAVATDTGVNNSPTVLNREVVSTVTMADGEVIVLGGMTSTRSTDNSAGLSWLPKMLRTTSKEYRQTELLLFLRLARVKT